jgi:hypothetical protein
MDLMEQLFAIKQIITLGGPYYDKETRRSMHRIPPSLDAGALKALDEAGRAVNTFESFGHDEAVAELKSLAAEWSIEEAADAFAASLWSAPWIWRAALTGKALGDAIPVHPFEPFSESSSDTCGICGFMKEPVDKTMAWYFGMTEGSPYDGCVCEHVILLREMKKLRRESGTPSPTKYDLWTLAAVFDLIGRLPPKTRRESI